MTEKENCQWMKVAGGLTLIVCVCVCVSTLSWWWLGFLRYLERLERAGFAPFTQDLQDTALTDLRLKMALAWRNFAGSL